MDHRILGLAVAGILVSFAPIEARSQPRVPVEVGMSYALGARAEDRFSRGMKKFRSSPDPQVLRAVSVDPFPVMESAEYYLRAGLLDSERHLLGLAFGNYFVADMPLLEIRNDGVMSLTDWAFRFPYFLFTYHYTAHIPGRWNRKLQLEWDGGAGFGFIYNSRWKVTGATFSQIQFLQYNIDQRGTGNIMRLELGLRRRIRDGLYLRVGLRSSLLHVNNYNGSINQASGTWYYAGDGSLIPLSSFNLVSFQSLTLPKTNSLGSAALIDSRAYHNSGVTELQFSIGYRW